MSKAKKRKKNHRHVKKLTLSSPFKTMRNQTDSKVEFVLDGAVYKEARKDSPISSNGSPRSRQDSRFYTSAGTFKYGNPKSFEQPD
jgi:hypothetical protein